jgi:hypothetical protein
MVSLAATGTSLMQALNVPMLLSVGSSVVTGYFWLIKMNQERAGLQLHRVGDFRPDRLQCCDVPGMETATWYGEIILANPSTLPRSVVGFQADLFWKGRWVPAKLVMEKKENVPWTVEPLRVLTRNFGCAIPVELGTTREQLLQPHRLRFTLLMLDGRRQVREATTVNELRRDPLVKEVAK